MSCAVASASVAGCASSPSYRLVCIEQSDDVLREIESGQLDACAPATAAWERRVAQLCGWVDAP